jgi:mRNA interferase MazF
MMRIGTMLSQGDIVLVPVPFTDLSSNRRRPVIVISNDAYHNSGEDMVVVAMTSNPRVTPYSFVISNSDLVQGTLNRPGTVRADKIYTLSRKIIVKNFGRVSNAVLDEIRKILAVIIKT